MEYHSFNCIKVSRSALQNNFRYIQKSVAAGAEVMAMVKADGYGHGMVMAARAFADAGCEVFGVAELREGVILRKSGINGRIFVTIGFDQEDVGLFFKYDLIPVVYTYQAALALSEKAAFFGRNIKVHIKVDTGMSRLGILADELSEFLGSLADLPGIEPAGVMSHFPESDDPLSMSTQDGYDVFSTACDAMKKRGGQVCHIANSGAVLNFPNTHCDMVRAGIALYGYHPAGKVDRQPGKNGRLIPAMSFVTQILQVKTLPAGRGVSYRHTYRTTQPTKIGVLPVGYEDGFSRSLSNTAEVLIGSVAVPVIGRICMNMCMVDVSGIDTVKAGDEVVIMGRQGDNFITADDIAEKMASISYEVLCMFGNNNNRMSTE